MSIEEQIAALETVTLEAKKLFSIDFKLSPPIICGSRAIVAAGGKAYGPMLNAELIEPTSDWITIKPNGVFLLDVNIVLKTDDGEHIYMHILGMSKRDPANPSNGKLRSSAVFETSAEKYKWLHEKVLRGQGTKEGPKIVMDYFDM